MSWPDLAIFLPAALAVAAAPGPTVLQIFAQAASRDPRRPASLIAGALAANALMVAATVGGVSALILASQPAFLALKWIGAAYLVYLGLCYWRMEAVAVRAEASVRAAPVRRLFLQAALTSLTNPKGLAFYLAFLPQFVSPGGDPHGRLALLGALYLGLCLIADLAYALAGVWLSKMALGARAMRLRNRVVGALLMLTGLSLLRFERP